MNTERLIEICRDVDEEAGNALTTKGADYPTNADRLSNFKATAELVNSLAGREVVTPAIVALVFFTKHLVPLYKFASGEVVESEPPVGRAADAQNYIKLMYALGMEQVPQTYVPLSEKQCDHPMFDRMPTVTHNDGTMTFGCAKCNTVVKV